MTAHPRIGIATHGTIELFTGMVAMLAPALGGFSVPGAIASVVIGSLVVGMALMLTGSPRQTLAWHRDFDVVALLGSSVGALALALSRDAAAALFLVAVVGVQLALNATTRYSTAY